MYLTRPLLQTKNDHN